MLRPSLPHLITWLLLLPGTAVMREEQQVETMLALASVTVLGVLEQGEPQPSITATLTSKGAGLSGALISSETLFLCIFG